MGKVLVVAMSLRKDSFNKKLAANVDRISSELKLETELLSINDFTLPIYDGDLEVAAGVPSAATQLGKKISEAKGVIFVTPEYNGSIPGLFKNVLDWLSRMKPVSLAGKKVLLMGTSPGALGAVRGLWHSKHTLDVLGALVYPELFGMPQGHLAFDESGKLKDSSTEDRLKSLLGKFQAYL